MQRLLTFIFLIAAVSCAPNRKLNTVPSIDHQKLPPLRLANVQPRTILVHVKNFRRGNINELNAVEVEASVARALAASLQRGGFKLGKSKVALTVEIFECNHTGDDKVCVQLLTQIRTLKNSYEFTTQVTSPDIDDLTSMSSVYQKALTLIINNLEGKSAKIM